MAARPPSPDLEYTFGALTLGRTSDEIHENQKRDLINRIMVIRDQYVVADSNSNAEAARNKLDRLSIAQLQSKLGALSGLASGLAQDPKDDEKEFSFDPPANGSEESLSDFAFEASDVLQTSSTVYCVGASDPDKKARGRTNRRVRRYIEKASEGLVKDPLEVRKTNVISKCRNLYKSEDLEWQERGLLVQIVENYKNNGLEPNEEILNKAELEIEGISSNLKKRLQEKSEGLVKAEMEKLPSKEFLKGQLTDCNTQIDDFFSLLELDHNSKHLADLLISINASYKAAFPEDRLGVIPEDETVTIPEREKLKEDLYRYQCIYKILNMCHEDSLHSLETLMNLDTELIERIIKIQSGNNKD